MKRILISVLMLACFCSCSSKTYLLNVGTYGDHWYKVCFRYGSFSKPVGNYAQNPSYLLSCPGNRVYAVSENDPKSAVYSFIGGIISGFCTEIGGSPCYLTKIGNRILTADYSGGSMSVFALDENGIIGGRIQVLEFKGSGPVSSRQEQAHIHQVRQIPAEMGEGILVTDLGSDKIYVLKENEDCFEVSGELSCPAGSGPRHIEFNTAKSMMYCVCELSGHVLVWKSEKGEFSLVQDVIADEFDGGGSADIHMSADGQYLYTTHRLVNDGICTFKILGNGQIEKIGRISCSEHPRNFWLTPDGKFMLVACTNAKEIQVFRIGKDGMPRKTMHKLTFEDDRPTCIIEVCHHGQN